MTSHHLADHYRNLYDVDDDEEEDFLRLAQENYHEALYIYTRVFGSNSHQCASVHSGFGDLYRDQAAMLEYKLHMGLLSAEEYRRAVIETCRISDEAYKRAMRIYKVVMGVDSSQFRDTIAARGRVFELQGDQDRANRFKYASVKGGCTIDAPCFEL